MGRMLDKIRVVDPNSDELKDLLETKDRRRRE